MPQGWDNQLDSEMGINVAYLHKWRHVYNMDKKRQYEFGKHGGFILGNVYSLASVGAMARWGTHLKTDIGPPTISPGFTGMPVFRPSPQFNWYLFGGVEVRAVARNIFLDGNTVEESHSIEKNNFVADLQFGAVFQFQDMRISIGNILRSKEFETQKEPARYGAINITIYTSK